MGHHGLQRHWEVRTTKGNENSRILSAKPLLTGYKWMSHPLRREWGSLDNYSSDLVVNSCPRMERSWTCKPRSRVGHSIISKWYCRAEEYIEKRKENGWIGRRRGGYIPWLQNIKSYRGTNLEGTGISQASTVQGCDEALWKCLLDAKDPLQKTQTVRVSTCQILFPHLSPKALSLILLHHVDRGTPRLKNDFQHGTPLLC